MKSALLLLLASLSWAAPDFGALLRRTEERLAAAAASWKERRAQDVPRRPAFAVPEHRKGRYLEIMLEGSLNVSRTKTAGRRFYAPEEVQDVAATAERNFREAAAHMLDRSQELPLSLSTARRLNVILTRDLIPPERAGQLAQRQSEVREFFSWLESSEAERLGAADPVALAERIHDRVSALDGFPDGNGRTARLLADLALLRRGRAPALYTGIEDYFARGNARAPVDAETRLRYFREVCARGEAAAERGPAAVANADAEPSEVFLESLRRQPGHDGPPR